MTDATLFSAPTNKDKGNECENINYKEEDDDMNTSSGRGRGGIGYENPNHFRDDDDCAIDDVDNGDFLFSEEGITAAMRRSSRSFPTNYYGHDGQGQEDDDELNAGLAFLTEAWQ
jgi:hypothetical protein